MNMSHISTAMAATVAMGGLVQAASVLDKTAEELQGWKKALTVYNNEDSFITKVRFAWMEQYQMASVQPNGSNGLHLKDGGSPFNHEFRRSWVGMYVDFRTGTQFHTWARLGGLPYRHTWKNGRTVRNFSYTDLFDIWVKQDIKAVKGLSVKAGKLKPLFTTDYSTSSSALACVERSFVGNQYGLDSNWGLDITYSPNKQDTVYFQLLANDRASASKSNAHRDAYRDGRGLKGEFGWEDKCFAILGASHKFNVTESGYHKVSFQYAHDFNNSYDNETAPGANCYGIGVKDALSLGYEVKKDKWLFLANLVGNCEMQNGGGNNIGIQLQPVYSLTDRVDLVFRYTGMTGDNACKLAADRYICTNTTASSWVDSINAFYFGADFYLSPKDKNMLKLMLGAEYTTARKNGSDCYNGWEYTSAIRWNF